MLPKKFLVVLRGNNEVQKKSDDEIRSHCSAVWQQLKPSTSAPFELVILAGAGTNPEWIEDQSRLIAGLEKLGIVRAAGAGT